MEKKKFEMKLGDAYEAMEDVSVGGETIHVRKHIPLEEKMMLASDMVQMTAMPDEELGIVTTSSLEEVCKLYLILKYYTDVDLEGVEAKRVFDWIIGYDGAEREIEHIVALDYYYVEDMVYTLRDNIKAKHEARHGLAHAVKTTFGFLFDGRDITETLAESREISETMLDTVGRLNEAAKKEEAGRVKVAGNVINIGKKNK